MVKPQPAPRGDGDSTSRSAPRDEFAASVDALKARLVAEMTGAEARSKPSSESDPKPAPSTTSDRFAVSDDDHPRAVARVKPPSRRHPLVRALSAWAISGVVHLVIVAVLGAIYVAMPPEDDEAVIHVRLAMPEIDVDLDEAPLEEDGFDEELPEDGVPVETDEPTDEMETPDEVEEEIKVRGDPDGRSGDDIEADSEGAVVGVGGGGPAARFGHAEGGGLIESQLTTGARRGLDRFRADGLDVVICFDSTGSMGPAIEAAKRDATGLVRFVGGLVPRVRFGLVTYGDQVRDVVPLTADHDVVVAAIARQAARGGGDTPEGVDKALARALDDELGWGLGRWRTIVIVGDAPPHAPDRAAAISTVRTARGSDDKLIVSTVSVAGGGIVETFAELSNAGGGDAVALGDAAGVGRALLALAFGPEVGPEIERWARDHASELKTRYGFDVAPTEYMALGLDPTRPPAERLDALLTALELRRLPKAPPMVLQLLLDHPELWEIDGVALRVARAAHGNVASSDPAVLRREALLALVRVIRDAPRPEAAGPLVALLEQAREDEDASFAREVASALTRVGGRRAGDALGAAARKDPDLLDEGTLLAAAADAPGTDLVDVVVERLLDDEEFRKRCIDEGKREHQVAIAVLLLHELTWALPPDDRDAAPDRLTATAPDEASESRLAALASLSDEVLIGAIRAGLAGASASPEKTRDLARAILAVSARLGRSRLADLVRDGVPIGPLLDATDTPEGRAAPALLPIVATMLHDAPRRDFRKIVGRIQGLDDARQAELAAAIEPRLAEGHGSRRRDLFRIFARGADDRGLDTIVDAVRWDSGKLLPEAIEALERITDTEFPKPAKSRRGRAEQALRIEWWWENNRHEWGYER